MKHSLFTSVHERYTERYRDSCGKHLAEGDRGSGDPGSMTPTTSTSASSLWQYINDSMEQYGSLDLTSAATSKAPIVAGVGLVLDTRQQDALARLAGIEKQMSEMHGTADQTCGEVRLSVLAFRWCGAHCADSEAP